MNKQNVFWTSTVALLSIVVPATVGAAIVPCAGDAECTVCDLAVLGNNILDFIVYASTFMATLLFLNAGILYISSSGNPGNISRAHHIFSRTLVGIILILTSWIVIDFVMKTLYDEGDAGWGPWNTILCNNSGSPQGSPPPLAPPRPPSLVPTPTPTPTPTPLPPPPPPSL